MPNPLAALLRTETRTDFPSLSWDQWLSFFTFNGHSYPLGINQTLKPDREDIGNDFRGYVHHAYKQNGVVFAVMLVRLMLFSQARFTFRDLNDQSLSYSPELDVLRKPWPGATTGDLLARVIQDADLAGNAYVHRDGDRLKRLRPDWVTIQLASDSDEEPARAIDGEVKGYVYHPGGLYSAAEPVPLGLNEVAHYAPIPDPEANFRGMSWLTPVIREIKADSSATRHKLKFFENGATPNMVVKSPIEDPEKFKKLIDLIRENHEGTDNAYRTLFLAGGADAEVVGLNFQQMDFKVTQGAGETRIAAAGGVPPVVVGLSEGLQGSSLNAGNYGQARRRLSDGTLWPLWENLAGSMATVINEPGNKELWIDDRGVKFLREDEKDAAEIRKEDAQTIESLVRAGFEPTTAEAAVRADDFSLLKHTGLVSVQLQPPGTTAPTQEPADD